MNMILALFGVITMVTLVYGKEKSYTYLSAKVMEEEVGIDWWNILNADATCCPLNADEQSCNAEAGSKCMFLKANNPIAIDAKAQCVGVSFFRCKRQDINACCSPSCNGNPPNTGNPNPPNNPGENPPACTATNNPPQTPNPTPNPVTTPEPTPNPTPDPVTTPEPTPEQCLIDVNYAFEGMPCQISGDPHFKKVNGGKHDFQGQPTLKDTDGNLLRSFYYVAPCHGYTSADMPISILSNHYHWGTRDVSGIDYFTIELTKDDGDKIYVYASSEINGYATDAAATKDYDDTNANGLVTQLVDNVPTDMGGGKFDVTYDARGDKDASFVIKIDNDDNKKIYIYMQGQMNKETDIWYHTQTHRYRMHYVYMTQSSAYKCMSCGLCGDYSGDASSDELVLCDGQIEEVRSGWNGAHTPEAYDLFGLTYEYHFYNNDCEYDYDIRDNKEDLNYQDPCDANIADAVETACQQKRSAADIAVCCDDVIGGTVCDDIEEDCKFDACVVATDLILANQDLDEADAIEAAVSSLFTATIDGACHIPGIGDAVDDRNILLGDYLGCYKDSSTRRFEWPTSGVRSLTGDLYHNTAECIKLCVDPHNGGPYDYMGLQYDVECFCGNDYTAITSLGLRDPSENQCGMKQLNTDQYNAFGCWGGGWTNCVYDIRANHPAANVLMVEFQSNQLLNDNINNINNINMEIMTIIGGIILFGAAGLVYKRYYDKNIKDGKYIPITDDNKV